MCGFAGELRFDNQPADTAAVVAMSQVLAPRGPDGGGLVQHGPLAVAHRRLKILDLSQHAQQPMLDPALGLGIVFNGCIYNYRSLRGKLQQQGYVFFSNGDTEVLLKAYHAWGPAFVEQLNGMFAFVLWERDSGKIVMGRDRLGIKPLYYSDQPGALRFASSLPALLAGGGVDTRLDPVALHHYFTLHAVVPAPHTLLQGVRKLPPATVREFTPGQPPVDTVYWNPSFEVDPAIDPVTAVEETHRLLRQAVKRRMIADVPVGVLLSGGLDSSLIVALLAEQGQTDLQTFSVGFEALHGESGDEFQYSDQVAHHFGTRHHQLQVPTADLLDHLGDCVAAMSEPMVSHDAIGFYLLSREVSRQVRVVQSGQGADEVFGGYHWYPGLSESTDITRDYPLAFFDRDHAEMDRMLVPQWVQADYTRAFVEAHLQQPGADTALNRALRLDTRIMLVDDPVKRVDNMTMAWGLEARVPFLDHELVEFAARLPAASKLEDGGKAVLKTIGRQILPRGVVDRPKGYFPVPALKHLDGETLDFVNALLDAPDARWREIIRPEYLTPLRRAPRDHMTPLRGSKLWQIALLELWLKTHLPGSAA